VNATQLQNSTYSQNCFDSNRTVSGSQSIQVVITLDVIGPLTELFLLMPSRCDGWRVLPNRRTLWLLRELLNDSNPQASITLTQMESSGKGPLFRQGLSLNLELTNWDCASSPRFAVLVYFLRTTYRSPTGNGNFHPCVVLCEI